ncbi:MAG: hypothetical protein ILO34_02765, partial [Kiritimatiellae bacterium]|nr:hypothetical protein [Kiritimatiellia bacterium]
IVYKGSLLSAGSGETAALAFLVSRNADMSDAVSYTNDNRYAAGDAIEYEIFESKNSTKYIVPGVTYYVRAVFTGTNGKKNVSSPMKVTTLAGAAFKAGGFAASMNSESAVGTFSGVLETVGAYTNALVSFYAGMGDNNFTLVDTVTITEDNTPFSFNYTVPTDGSVVYYYYKVVNSCPTKTWSTTTDTMYQGIEYVFYWKGNVHSGKWEDPDNWTCNVAGMEGRYPDEWVWFDRADHHAGGAHWHSNHIAMFPSDDTNVTCEVSLSSYVKLNRMYFLTEGMKIRFTGTGYADMGDGLGGYNDPNKSGIYHDNYSYPVYTKPNVEVTYRNMYLDFARFTFRSGDMIVLDNAYARMRTDTHLADGDYSYPDGASLRLVNGAVYSHDGGNFHGYGSNFSIVIDDSTFKMPSGGQLHLARNGWCGGYWNVEFLGSRPVFDVPYYAISSCGDGAGNDANLNLVFHVPKGGYSEAPLKCHNNDNWAFYYAPTAKPLNITVAADSPACFPGNLLDTALITVDQTGNFNAANLVLASGEEFRTYYADGNRAEVEYSFATQIRARIATKKLPTSIHVR